MLWLPWEARPVNSYITRRYCRPPDIDHWAVLPVQRLTLLNSTPQNMYSSYGGGAVHERGGFSALEMYLIDLVPLE